MGYLGCCLSERNGVHHQASRMRSPGHASCCGKCYQSHQAKHKYLAGRHRDDQCGKASGEKIDGGKSKISAYSSSMPETRASAVIYCMVGDYKEYLSRRSSPNCHTSHYGLVHQRVQERAQARRLQRSRRLRLLSLARQRWSPTRRAVLVSLVVQVVVQVG